MCRFEGCSKLALSGDLHRRARRPSLSGGTPDPPVSGWFLTEWSEKWKMGEAKTLVGRPSLAVELPGKRRTRIGIKF